MHASQGVAQDALRVAQRFSCNAVYVRTGKEGEGIKRQREKEKGRGREKGQQQMQMH